MKKYLVADFSKRDNPDKGLTDFYRNPENRPFAREPVLALMPDGSLICVFLSGGQTEPDNRNVVLFKKSNDQGKSWTDTKVLFSHSFQGLWSTEIFTGFDRVTMFITMYNADYPSKALQNYVSYSDDCGETWSYPVSVDHMLQSASIRRGITLSNGEVLFPLYFQISHHCFDWNKEDYYNSTWWDGIHSECSVAITSDGGESYQRFGTIKDGTDILWEPNCIELENGHILMYIRTQNKGKLALSESYDYGRSWSKPQLTDIDHPGSKVTLFKIKNKICMINNYCCDKRTHLQLRVSYDNCNTWEKIMPMDDSDAFFCYPHVAVDHNNEKIYIIYENYSQHYLNVLSFDEI